MKKGATGKILMLMKNGDLKVKVDEDEHVISKDDTSALEKQEGEEDESRED